MLTHKNNLMSKMMYKFNLNVSLVNDMPEVPHFYMLSKLLSSFFLPIVFIDFVSLQKYNFALHMNDIKRHKRRQ